jgi:hypothetical protein
VSQLWGSLHIPQRSLDHFLQEHCQFVKVIAGALFESNHFLAGVGAPQPVAVQLIDTTEPEGTVTVFVTQFGRSSFFTETEWTPGETTKVKSVSLPIDRLSIVMVAPGGVDVTDNLPGAGGLCDGKSVGNRRREHNTISRAGNNR